MPQENEEIEDTETTEGTETPEKTVSAKAFYTVKQQLKDAKAKLDAAAKAEEDRKTAELSEIERLKKENAGYQTRIQTFEIEKKKTDTYSAIKSKVLGDNYTLENEDKILKTIGKLSYNDETFEDDLKDLIELAKKPKKAGASTLNLGELKTKQIADKAAKDYSGAELRAIQQSDPEKFKAILAERKG